MLVAAGQISVNSVSTEYTATTIAGSSIPSRNPEGGETTIPCRAAERFANLFIWNILKEREIDEPGPLSRFTRFYSLPSNKYLTSPPLAATLASSRHPNASGRFLVTLRPRSQAQKIEHLRGRVKHLFYKSEFYANSFTTY